MVALNTEHTLPPDLHSKPAKEPIPIIKTINLDDEYLSSGFGTPYNNLDELQHQLERFLQREHKREAIQNVVTALASAPSATLLPLNTLRESAYHSESTVDFAKITIRSILTELAKELPDPKLKSKFTSSACSEKEQLEVLRYTTEEKRLDFARTLHTMAGSDRSLKKFVENKLDNVMSYLSVNERATLIREWLPKDTTFNTTTFILAALEASSSYAQFSSLVNQVGKESLIKTDDVMLHEAIALAEIGVKVRSLKFPTMASTVVEKKDVDAALDRLTEQLQAVLSICKSDPMLAKTKIARDYIKTAEDDVQELKEDTTRAKSPAELRAAINTMSLKASLEFKYGIHLTSDKGSSPSSARRWSDAELQDVRSALSQIPEGKLIFTPFLCEIRRVATIHNNSAIQGLRLEDWSIAIADSAVDDILTSGELDGKDSLPFIVAHEIGHAIQLGFLHAYTTEVPNQGYQFDHGDPNYNFDEFLKISGWQAIDPVRYTINGSKVTLDGRNYELDRPIVHNGQSLVLTAQGGNLHAYRSDAHFSHRDYSRTNPWEDWAESFAEYCLMPKRLINDAPEKFKYMEQEFHKYENRPEILKLLQMS